jgi:hypothetical protein
MDRFPRDKLVRSPYTSPFCLSPPPHIPLILVFNLSFSYTSPPPLCVAERGFPIRCPVTQFSALSQASCRSPDDRRGAGLLPEKVGVHVVVTMCKKSPAKAAVAITAGKCQEVAALHHAVLFGPIMRRCLEA